jgi:hypothetical protein
VCVREERERERERARESESAVSGASVTWGHRGMGVGVVCCVVFRVVDGGGVVYVACAAVSGEVGCFAARSVA